MSGAARGQPRLRATRCPITFVLSPASRYAGCTSVRTLFPTSLREVRSHAHSTASRCVPCHRPTVSTARRRMWWPFDVTRGTLCGRAIGVAVAVAGPSLWSASDAGGNFTLNNVPPADVLLTFSAPGVSASVPVGAVAVNDVVHLSVTVSAGTATIDAQQKTAADNAVEAMGTLSDLDLAGRLFRIGSTAVQVPDGASITRADAPAAFAD